MDPVDNTPKLVLGSDLIERITTLEEKLKRLRDAYDDLADTYCDLHHAEIMGSK